MSSIQILKENKKPIELGDIYRLENGQVISLSRTCIQIIDMEKKQIEWSLATP